MDPDFNKPNTPEEKDEFFDPIPEERPGERENLSSPRPTRKQSWQRRLISLFLALVLLAAGFLVGWFVRYYAIDADMRSFLWALDVTERYYYPEDFSRGKVLESAGEDATGAELLSALNETLDDYSQYYSPEEYAAYLRAGAGQSDDLGIAFLRSDDSGTVALVSNNSPAFGAGIRKGMSILAYGSEEDGDEGTLTPFTTYAAFSSDVSRYGSNTLCLKMGYEEDGSDAALYTVTASDYQTTYCSYRDSESAFYFTGEEGTEWTEYPDEALSSLDEDTAYIRIDEFSGNVSNEFEYCLKAMKERGRTDLILDLRTNGGGYLDDLQQIASHLMRDAEGPAPEVQVARYKGGREEVYYAYGNDFSDYFSETSEVYLLADENTASASECLIGVLVDYDTLSYDHIYLREAEDGTASTYGKGIMQTSFVAANGAAMKLTVAGIYWPVSDKSIHGTGVTPEDGCVAVSAPLIWGKEDKMLSAVIEAACSAPSIPSIGI